MKTYLYPVYEKQGEIWCLLCYAYTRLYAEQLREKLGVDTHSIGEREEWERK